MPKPKSCIPLKLCTSSNIRAHGYRAEDQILEIQFKSGGAYQYSPVPPALYAEFLKAESLGRFLHTRIRGNADLKAEPVERDEPEQEDKPAEEAPAAGELKPAPDLAPAP